QDRQPGFPLDLKVTPDHTLGGASDQRLRVQLQPQPFEYLFGIFAMMRGEKREDRVDLPRRGLLGVADDLFNRLARGLVAADRAVKSHRGIVSIRVARARCRS